MKSVSGIFLVVMTVYALAVAGGPEAPPVAPPLEQAVPLEQFAPIQQAPPVISDSDRGCCVLHTEKIKCAYANRKYCRTKAEEAEVTFDFHKDKVCKNVPECPTSP